MYRYYMLFTMSVVLWLSGAIVAKSPDILFEFHFRMLIVFAAMLSFYLLMFIGEFTGRKVPVSVRFGLIVVGVLIAYLSLFTQLLTRRVYVEHGSIFGFSFPKERLEIKNAGTGE